MKDDEAKRAATSDEDRMIKQNGEVMPVCSMEDQTSLSHAAVNSNGKSRSKPTRKRQSTSSPEEDIIDGFAISSFSSLEALEVRRNVILCDVVLLNCYTVIARSTTWTPRVNIAK